jgi:hypothetical protein
MHPTRTRPMKFDMVYDENPDEIDFIGRVSPVNVLFQAFCEARPREKVKEEPEIKKQRFTIRGVFGFA